MRGCVPCCGSLSIVNAQPSAELTGIGGTAAAPSVLYVHGCVPLLRQYAHVPPVNQQYG